ncbi:hypothetical protein [Alkalibacterium indicireducens]|uniref:DUF4145 domain-containing protein n=1 Tax=Alkalibacterium indicireducens TaxID=398758 RepID=A0ABN1BA83_9LACT
MDNIYNPSKVNDSRTREYFEEILANYSIGSYRTSVVQLYTVTVSDLLFKLENISNEIRILDEDHTLVRLYESIKQQIKDKPHDSSWEKKLIDRVHKDTELIDNHTIVQLTALKDIRNLSAHPSFRDSSDGELSIFNPTQNEVVTFIKIMYENIFTKPPFYIGNTVDYFTETLSMRKPTFINDYNFMESYLKENFFSKMDSSLLFKLFKSLWKLTFLVENDNVEENREVLYYSILIMAKYFRENRSEVNIVDMLSKSNAKLKIDTSNPYKVFYLTCFLMKNTDIYSYIQEIGQKEFENVLEEHSDVQVLAHFFSKDLDDHIEKIDKPIEGCHENTIKMIHTYYTEVGYIDKINKLLIKKYSEAKNFNTADASFKRYIEPFYKKFTDDNLISFFEETNGNSQLNSRGRARSENSIIREEVQKRELEIDFEEDFKNINFNIDNE